MTDYVNTPLQEHWRIFRQRIDLLLAFRRVMWIQFHVSKFSSSLHEREVPVDYTLRILSTGLGIALSLYARVPNYVASALAWHKLCAIRCDSIDRRFGHACAARQRRGAREVPSFLKRSLLIGPRVTPRFTSLFLFLFPLSLSLSLVYIRLSYQSLHYRAWCEL